MKKTNETNDDEENKDYQDENISIIYVKKTVNSFYSIPKIDPIDQYEKDKYITI